MATDPTPGPITTLLDAQGVLAPGQPGYWQVWGADARHIQAGDLVLSKTPDGVMHEDVILEAGRRPIGAYVLTEAGEDFTLGALVRIVILRQGTHNTLAPAI
jgi:hypothetical protein